MKTTVLSVIMLLSTFVVNANYSSHHFDPVRLAVGSKEIPNSSFWSSQGAKIQHFIVEDDSFTGGRARLYGIYAEKQCGRRQCFLYRTAQIDSGKNIAVKKKFQYLALHQELWKQFSR